MKLSPQVRLYREGTPPPSNTQQDWIVLPHLPSTSFGDGTHPTTRLCAGAVDFLCRQQAFTAVLDVGTGTGVLARIARARGVKMVVGTEIDPAAILAATNNAALDSHPVELEILNALPDHWGPIFDLVVANILENPLLELAPNLVNALAPGGRLLISGFTPLQAHSLRSTYISHGLTFISESHLGEWAMLTFCLI